MRSYPGTSIIRHCFTYLTPPPTNPISTYTHFSAPYTVTADELMQQWSNVVEDKIMEGFLYNLKRQMKQKV